MYTELYRCNIASFQVGVERTCLVGKWASWDFSEVPEGPWWHTQHPDDLRAVSAESDGVVPVIRLCDLNPNSDQASHAKLCFQYLPTLTKRAPHRFEDTDCLEIRILDELAVRCGRQWVQRLQCPVVAQRRHALEI